ncbi:MAG TPA: hypothetical protein G4O18_09340 [Dehalococcoidia bacterium]|nr:hypothetical protein [Dehalococcoidia bacterium]
MSRFIDILNRSSQTTAQAIGFRTTKAAQSKHRIQLVAAVSKGTTDNITDYVTGADAGLLRVSKIGSSASTLKKAIPPKSDIPWGIWPEETSQEEIQKGMKSGCDFIVLPAGATLVVPPDDSIGIIIQIDTSVAEGPLRTLNELPLDAVLVTPQSEIDSSLTWHQLMLLQRFGDLLTKPILVSIPSNTGADELQLLQDAGIDGVVVETGPDQPSGETTRLRQMIDGLKPPPTHKQHKMDALLPRTSRDTETMAEIEEEDEDDEDD